MSAASVFLRVSLCSQLFRYLLFILLSLGWLEGTAQTAYPAGATSAGGPYYFEIDNPAAAGLDQKAFTGLGMNQYLEFHVVKGYSYTFSVTDAFNNGTRIENLTIYNAANNLYLAGVSSPGFSSGGTGTSISNWQSPISGVIKVLLTRTGNTGGSNSGILTYQLNSIGNTQDLQTSAGSDTWIGHIYNWTGTSPPNPFASAGYAGYYSVAGDVFSETFGGNTAFFNILSSGTQRASIYTERFAVRYRMRSSRPAGCYTVTLTADDGVRLYVDGVAVINQWRDQAASTFSAPVYLNGASDLVLEYYESGGENTIQFGLTLNALEVTAPVFSLGPVSSRCQGAGTGTYTASSSNNTGLSYSLAGAGSSTINPATGVVNWDPGFTGTATITATAQGCNGPKTSTHTVTVNPLPVLTTAPSDVTVCENVDAQFTVSATGTGLSYQWQADYLGSWVNVPNGSPLPGIVVSGATTPALTIRASGAYAGNITFRAVVASSSGCPVTSPVAILTINRNIGNNTISAAQTICSGSSPAALSGTPPNGGNGVYSFQWQSSPDNSTWTDIPGATLSGYSPGVLTATTYYRRIVSAGICSPGISPSVGITVNPVPPAPAASVTAQPTCSTANGTITITSPVGAGITYSIDGTSYQSGTVFAGVAPGSYPVTTKSAAGCISAATIVTVNPQPATPVATITASGPVSFNYGGSVTLTANPAAGYVWSNGATTQSITLRNVAESGNYTVTVTNASGCSASSPATAVTINKASLTVMADDQTKTYDGNAYSGGNGVTITGFAGTDDVNSLGGTLVYNGTSQGAKNAGTYTIDPSGYTSANYDISYMAGTLTINPKALTVTANDQTKTYDGTAYSGGNGVTITGFAGTDDVVSLGGTLVYNGTSQGAKSAGTYTIDPSGYTSANYNIAYTSGTLLINPKGLTVTANNQTKTYGALNPALTFSYAGFAGTDNAGSLTTAPIAATTATTTSGVGTYPITVSGGVSPNYTFTYVGGTLTINPKGLTVTAANQSKTYGATNPALTFSYAGFAGTDNAGSLTTVPVAATTATTTSGVGTYPITVSGGVSPNYTFTYVGGTLTIDPKALTVMANDQTKTYDGNAYSGGNGVTITGFAGTDDVTSLGGTLVYNGTSQGAKNAGTYTIAPTGYTSANYNISYTSGTLTINPKFLTVTANSQTKTYDGNAYSGGNGLTITGFAGTDDVTSLGGTPVYNGTSQGAMNAGTYMINPSGYTSANYNISYASGTLTINPKALTVTANNQTKTYDGNVYSGGNGVTITGFAGTDDVSSLGGTLVYSGTSQGARNIGSSYSIIPSGYTTGNYSITYSPGTLIITPRTASLVVTPTDKVYGTLDPSFTGTLTGFLAGDDVTATYSRTAGESVAGSPYTITGTLQAAPGVLDNYTITSTSADFSITRAPASVIVNASGKLFGDGDPALGGTVSGFLAGDNVTVSYSRTAGETVGGSPYLISANISAAAGVLDNYTITNTPASFTISNSAQTIAFGPLADKTYGDAAFTLTGTASSGLIITYTSSDPAVASVSGTTVTIHRAGTVTVTASQPGDGNYSAAAPVSRTFTVWKKTASLAPTAQDKVYGTPDPSFTGTLTGFLAGDDVTATYSRTAGESVAGSPYTITGTLQAAPGVLDNYTITSTSADFSITRAPASVIVNASGKLFGDADPALSGTVSGFLAGDNVTVSYSRAAGETVGGSPYLISAAISAAAGVLDNYSITNTPASFTISNSAQTIAFGPLADKTYGDAAFTLTGTASSGLIITYTSSDPAVASVSGTTVTIHKAGTVTITASQPGDGNYSAAAPASRTFTVLKKTASLAATAQDKVYGTPDPSFTGTLTGFLAGDNVTATYSRTAGESVAGSPYTITGTLQAAPGVLDNYTITSTSADFSITRAPASVIVNASGKLFGDADPALSGTVSGFLAGDNVTVSYSRAAGETVGGSPYLISAAISAAPGVLDNYTITNTPASFTISNSAQTIAFGPLADKTYGDAAFSLTGTASSGLIITYTSSDPAVASVSGTTVTIHKAGTVTITASQPGDGNYSAAAPVSRSLTINRAPLVITADSKSKTFDGLTYSDGYTVSYGAFAGTDGPSDLIGVPVFGGDSQTATAAGPHVITVGGVSSPNYSITFNDGVLTIGKSGQTIAFYAPGTKTYGDVPFDLTATASSGLPVTYLSSDPGVASVIGNTLTIHRAGTITITASQGGDGNYHAAVPVFRTLTILRKNITVALTGTVSKTYDGNVSATLAAANYSLDGIVGSDAVTLNYPISGSYDDKHAGTGKEVNVTGMELQGADALNYQLTSGTVKGNIGLITALPVMVTAHPKSKVYGGTEPALTYSASPAIIAGESFSGALVRNPGQGVGFYTINQGTLSLSGNYSLSFTDAELEITPATLTVRADHKIKAYNQPNPTLTASYLGLVNGDVPATAVLTSPVMSTTALDDSPAGDYPITASGGTYSPNYMVIYLAGTLTVGSTTPVITFADISKTYGDDDFDPEALSPSPVPITYSSDNPSVAIIVGGKVQIKGAGTARITASQAGDSNYEAAEDVVRQLTVLPAPLTVSALPETKTYDGTVYGGGNGVTVSGFVYSDTETSLGGSLAYKGTSQGAKNAGSYTIVPEGYISGNYLIRYEEAALEIVPAVLVITANDDSKEYDGSPYLGGNGVTYNGFVNGETETVLGGTLSYTGSSQGAVAVDTEDQYDIYPAGLSSRNYQIQFLHGHLAIYPRAVTVTADALSKVYGGPDPELTFRVTSGSLAPAESFSGSLTRVSGEAVGSYMINRGSLAVNSNYDITFIGADLTVTPKALTAALTGTVTKVYDGTAVAALSAGNFTLSGLVNADAVVLNYPASGTYNDANIGTGKPVDVSGLWISGPGASNYVLLSDHADGNVGSITAKTITVTAVAAAKVYGEPDPGLTYTYSGALEGSDSFSGALERIAGETAGSYTINRGTLSISSNYSIDFVPAQFAITPRMLTASLTGWVSKTYDGTVTAALGAGHFSLTGVIGADDVQLNFPASGVYDTKARGAGKTVTVTGLSIMGTASGNYTLASSSASGPVGEILAKTVLVDLKGAVTKEYDGTVQAVLQPANYELVGVIPADMAQVDLHTPAFGSYDTREKGTGKMVSADGLAITGPEAGNYLLASDNISNSIGEITAKAVTISLIGSALKVYDGTDLATLDPSSFQLTGVLTADQADVSIGHPGTGLYDSKDAGTGKTVTVSGLSISGPGAGNYYLASNTVSGPVGEISPRVISVAVTPVSRVYGSADPLFAYEVTSGAVVAGDGFSGSLTRMPGEDAGIYPIHQGSLTPGLNYSVNFTGGTLTITPAPLSVRADDKVRPYNTGNPALTVSYAGLVTGDNEAQVVLAPPTVTTAATTASPAGSYPIVVTGGTFSPNYTVSHVDGTLTVGSTKPVISMTNMTKTYGDSDFDPGATSPSPVTIVYSSDNESVARIIGNQVHIVGAGSVNITASQAADSNYEAADPVARVLHVARAPLVITAKDDSKIYDGVPYSGGNGVTYAGFVNGEDEHQLGGALIYTGSAQDAVDVDTEDHYDIYPDGLTSGNYLITFAHGHLRIHPRAITVAADAASKTYGDTDPALTFRIVSGSLAGVDTFSGALNRTAGESAGSYTINKGTLAVTDNYLVSYQDAAFTIHPATLTVRAGNHSRPYMTPNPALTVTYSGFRFGDDPASVVFSEASASTLAGLNSPVGDYEISVSGGSYSPNYVPFYQPGALTVQAGKPVISFTDMGKTYGDPDFDGGASSASPVPVLYSSSNPAIAVITSGNQIRIVGAGTAQITASQAGDSNFEAADPVIRTLTVSKAALQVTAANQTRTYGSFNPPLTFTYSGFVPGDDASGLASVPAATTTASPGSPAGTYPIGIGGGASDDYDFVYIPGTLTIEKATVSVRADDKMRTYGGPNPPFTLTYSGFVNGDDEHDLATMPGATTLAAVTSPAGTYPITVGGGVSQNYEFNYSAGSLTVGKATLMVTADDKSRTYGSANPVLTVSYSGFVNGEDPGVLTAEPVATTLAAADSPAGNYAIVAAGGLSDNYDISYTAGTLMVNKAMLTVTADDKSRRYGSANPALTVSYSGFVNGDAETDLDTAPIAVTTATVSTAAGSYPVTVQHGVSDNYDFTYNPGTLKIEKAPLTVKADHQSRRYGAANPLLTLAYAGFVNGDDPGVLVAEPSATTTAGVNSPVGTYAITVAGGASPNYDFSYEAGILTIEKAILTVTADDKSRIYGAANPALTVTYAGFVNGDSAAGLSILPSATTTAASASPAGIYPITVSGGDSGNYDFVYTAGKLTVGKAALTIAARDSSKVYDGTPFTGGNGVLYSGLVNGETSADLSGTLSFGGSSQSAKNAGTYAILPGGLASPNYQITFEPAVLQIQKAPLVITAENDSRVYDGAGYSGGKGVTYTGFVPGETASVLGGSLTYGGSSQGANRVARYTIIPSGLTSGNYLISFIGGHLDITPKPVTAGLAGIAEKYYDGNSEATLLPSQFTLDGVISGDRVQLNHADPARYADGLPGNPKEVTVSGLGLTGPDAANYTLVSATVSGAVGAIHPVTDLSVRLTADDQKPDVGSTVIFTLTATNNGPNDATGVSVGDQLKMTGFEFVSSEGGTYDHTSGLWNVGRLSSGESRSMRIVAKVRPSGLFLNTAIIIGAEKDPDLSNNNVALLLEPRPVADLSVALTIGRSGDQPAANLVFTITAKNSGPSAATGVQVTGRLKAGYTYLSDDSGGQYDPGSGIWSVGALAADSSAVIHITARVNDIRIYDHTTVISGAEADPDPTDNSVTVMPAVPLAVNDGAKVNENGSVTIPVLANDDRQGGSFHLPALAMVSAAAHGTVTVHTDGSVIYRPDKNYNGADSFSYRIRDELGTFSNTARVDLEILPRPVIGLTKSVSEPVLLADGTYDLTYLMVVANLNKVALDEVSVGDNLAETFRKASSFRVKGVRVNGTGLIANAGYDGKTDTSLLARESALAIGGSGTVTVEVNVKAGDYFGPFSNLAVASGAATDQMTGKASIATDVSNDGDLSAMDTSTAYPTTVRLTPHPAIGLAKSASEPVLQKNGTYHVTYQFRVTNLGNIRLDDVQVVDKLMAHIPAPASYTIVTPPQAGDGLVANAGFNGNTDRNLLAPGSSVGAGETGRISLTLGIRPNGTFGPFANTARVSGKAAIGEISVSDVSDNGTLADANGNGISDEAGENDPTVVSLTPHAAIGLAKAVSAPKLELNGSYTLTYTFTVKNYGNTELRGISVTDKLRDVFKSPARYTVKGIEATGTLKADPAFDGDVKTNLLDGSGWLAPGARENVTLVINVLSSGPYGSYANSAEAKGTSTISEIVTTDISTDGLDPDPDHDDDPAEDSERIPTIVTLTPVAVKVPEGFSPNGDGVNDRLIIENVLDARIHLELFNRWGNLVYRNPDYRNDWEGKVNQGIKVGEDVPDGTYYYIIILNGNEKYVSYITIKR